MTQWVTVKIPQALAEEADKFVDTNGYCSRADVVKDALRDFFEKHKKGA